MRPPEHQNDVAVMHFHRKHQHLHDEEYDVEQAQPPQSPPEAAAVAVTVEEEVEDVSVAAEDFDSSESEELPEYVCVDLHEIRKEAQCPICLGIIKRTRTVMECLHRFCRECIDKSMRMGNNECPACRTHCASRRSLRDDPRYDAIIAAFFPDIEKFEAEELAFQEEDKTRNKQIQASIAETLKRQSDALGRKRATNNDNTGLSISTPPQNFQNSQLRRRKRRRRNRATKFHESDDSKEANDCYEERVMSFSDEDDTEGERRKRKGRGGVGTSQPSSSTANLNGDRIEGGVEQRKGGRSPSPGVTWRAELLAWGRGGTRSNNRHGTGNGGISKSSIRSTRLAKLVEFLRNLEENDDEYFTLQAPPKTEKDEPFRSTEPHPHIHQSSRDETKNGLFDIINPCQDKLQMFKTEEKPDMNKNSD